MIISLTRNRNSSENNQSVPTQTAETANITFSPARNSVLLYNGTVTLSTDIEGLSIYYTTDGSTPSNNSTLYANPLLPNQQFPGKIIKAIAVSSNGSTSSVFESQYFYPILKSGQNKCYNLISNNMETCKETDHSGQDGFIMAGHDRSFNSLQSSADFPSDIITTGNVLGNVWTANNLGSTCVTCVNPYTPYKWNDATNFPNTFAGGYYWVNDNYPINVTYESMLGYVNWALTGGGNTGTRPVRCVSGDAKVNSLSDLGNGTILDNLYGLLWTKCLDGEDPVSCVGTANTHTYAQALNYCNSKNLDGRTWRLPNAYELETLVDLTSATAPYIKGASLFSAGLGTGSINSSSTYPNTNTDVIRLATATGQLAGAGNLKSTPNYTFCVTNF
ncbi:Lcl domain-containing protein [Leptospira sp. GIMC2001]|uniref:Lcl domain-containing protein n=1 Tax=Leptospira sp. GIMC2001 TaxID=1513297 RepID=UPI00234BEBE3|nr:DUF1566 domain-containing protein [Leptospira sp. GIMC2001]WCL49768.1 chitobiase/beta-hexosaminidase C-terminal domain-containing protein [Leptospira sp. GIMC2001]